MRYFANLLTVSSVLLAACLAYQNQSQPPQAPQPVNGDQVEQRISRLEQRVEQLEQILFSTARLSVAEAERRLAETQHTLEASEKLFARGFINDVQLQQDRFDVEQAIQELKLAKTERRGHDLAAEMDALNARQRLTEAIQQLDHTRELARREFASQWQVQQAQAEVELAERALKNAELKLDAAQQVESIKDK
jgi:multidrug resistance efflux pump